MSTPAGGRVTRNQVVQRWGTPQATFGSVNEPRTREEHGVRFNERWTYRRRGDDPCEPRERTIYWHRYDFVAAFVLRDDGTLVREDESTLLAKIPARLYIPPRQRTV